MKIDPLTRYKAKPHALLYPGNRELYVETINGGQRFVGKRDIGNALEKLKGHTCYVTSSLQRLRKTTGATEWVLSTWRGRDVRMEHVPSGVTVTSLRGTLEDAPHSFTALTECLNWLRGYGIAPASISTMAWNLFRASLSQRVTIGFDKEIGQQAFFGGRQQIQRPNTFRNMKAIDIKAAYPTAMAARPMALALREVDPSTTIDPTVAGLVSARVKVPKDMKYPPLPVRVDVNAIQFQWGDLEGTWTWIELDAARQLGCEIEVTKVWAPARTFDLFGPWWDMAQQGRELSPPAANLAKAIANSTWGQFAMKGDAKTEISWVDDKGDIPYETEGTPRGMPHEWAVHVAAEVTSRVRTQTLLEGLYGISQPSVHVDTDGIIVYGSCDMPKNSGNEFGQWREKVRMKTLEIKAPQFYRYNTAEDLSTWQYVASGMSKAQAAYTFQKNPDIITHISFLANDIVIPSTHSRDDQLIAQLLEQAKKLVV